MNDKSTLWAKGPSGREITIPILGLCGGFCSGKTLFALTVAPGVHPAGHPFAGKARTGIIDAEKSSQTYEGSSLGFDRFDIPELLVCKGMGSLDAIHFHNEFIEIIEKIPQGRYDVLVIDPATDIDDGVVDFIEKNCTKFNLTPGQCKIKGVYTGQFWGVVKDYWNKILLKMSQKCKTVIFTAHLRTKYVNNQPTMLKEPKGKETLTKLASLYLWLDRSPIKEKTSGKSIVPKEPKAKIHKGRLCDTVIGEGYDITIIPLLPDEFEGCTPNRIREYIHNPPEGPSVVSSEELSDDMKLFFQLALETQRNEANNAELELLERRNQLMAGLAGNPAKAETPAAVKPTGNESIGAVASKTATTAITQQPAVSVSSPASGFVAASTFGQPKPQADPVSAPNEPATPEPQAAAPTPEEKAEEPPFVVDAPANAEQFTSNTDLVRFPGPTNSREESIEILKKGMNDGLFTADDRNEVLKINNVGKISELTESSLDNVVTTFQKVAEIVKAADERGIPRGKISEFVAMRKEPSLFLSSPETKAAILKTIKQVPLKN